MTTQLPEFYRRIDDPDEEYEDATFVDVYFIALGAELQDIAACISLMYDSIGILESQNWVLAFWERALNLPIEPPLPLVVRQAKVKEKVVGWGDYTMVNLVQLFKDYGSPSVQITPQYNVLGVLVEYDPGSVYATEAYKAAVNFTPAHIELVPLVKVGRTWGDLNNSGVSWADLNERGWTWGTLNQ
jgi:hypothetical protein